MTKNKENEIKTEQEVKLTPIERLTIELEKLDNNQFKILFYVLDSKGNPNGSLANIYVMAFMLQELGYEVLMLHSDTDFQGVGEWMGEKYAKLPHANIEKDKISINVSDILVIPELFSNVQSQTSKLPCKRIVLCQQYSYLYEFLPIGSEFGKYGILDVITTSKGQEALLKDVFPYVKTKIIQPSIAPYFYKGIGEKELVVAIASKDQSFINRVIKPFYLKYPLYKFLTFKDLRSLPQETYAEEVRNSAALVWIDTDTNFGYSAIEAIKSGTIVIAKMPEIIPDWALEEDGETLTNAVIWVDKMNDIPRVIASVVQGWMNDNVPEILTESMATFKDKFTREQQKEQVKTVFNEYIEDRKKEIRETIILFEKDLENKEQNK